MTFDEAIDAIAQETDKAINAAEWLLQEWDTTAPHCRALLRGYVDGKDLSERTEQALGVLVLLLGDRKDTDSFADLCRLARDTERCESVLGEDGLISIIPPVLINTFDGDRTALHRLVETPDVDSVIRGDALLVLAYLARSRHFPERELYDYLAALPDRLQPQAEDYVWFGWVRAVAALGFAGLSGRAEQIFQRGLVDPMLIDSAGFWADLRESQDDPHGTTGRAWDQIGPMGSAIDWMTWDGGPIDEPDAIVAEPIRNPLRHVGRNDPCPCGSGRKYKKCCLPV